MRSSSRTGSTGSERISAAHRSATGNCPGRCPRCASAGWSGDDHRVVYGAGHAPLPQVSLQLVSPGGPDRVEVPQPTRPQAGARGSSSGKVAQPLLVASGQWPDGGRFRRGGRAAAPAGERPAARRDGC
jgi:hypothetical protein